MKHFKAILLSFVIIFISCEDVIDLDLEKSKPRLVVEASIVWIKGTNGNAQQIKLTTTAPYFQEENPPVTDAQITVVTENGQEFPFPHISDGLYYTDNFEPALNESYQLYIYYNNETYSATEEMIPVTNIDFIEQNANGGFGGDDFEIKAFYSDPPNEENFYLFSFRNGRLALEIYDDQFNDGNQIFGYYSNEDIAVGDEINIRMEGISEAYYDYLFILRSQAGGGGGPFETQPATVRGNLINETNPENYALGYFRLSEAVAVKYTVE